MDKVAINKITEQIINAAFTVSNALGCGFLEKVYENSLCIELKKRNINYEQQKAVTVHYGNEIVGEYFADILVEGTVVVELKTTNKIESAHEAQLLNYLKATGMKIGLLLNFAAPKLEIRRMINDI